ncbi:hypothetical protein H4687_003649 [Streptomyces stelliscabiei]|uniref:Uncharacterized protein n=1 Tax=Streptomyces stelliscabiei TaxID=146820 RepID=A0A8I0P3G4_9ACTN|nr:hypothetical protein [Streptomyces stelliscabiei]
MSERAVRATGDALVTFPLVASTTAARKVL